jgi:hypothetical protein
MIAKLKENLIVYGSTGTGKTEILKRISSIYKIPIVIEDATSLSEIGYVGRNITDMLEDLYLAAGKDLELAQKHKKPKNITWVFSESGFAPRLHEQNASFYLPNVGIVYFSISEPYFDGNSVKPANSQILTNVDELFMTEYSQYRINEILRSYASAVSKAALQASAYNSNNNASLLLGLMSTVYTVSTSSAEIRTWATLPKHIYITRITNNKSNLNTLDLDDSIKSEIKQNKNYLVYKRILGDTTIDTKLINIK